MRRETAQRLGLRTTSDLAAAINAGMDIALGCNAEFYGRKDGLMPMQDAYGRKFPRRTIARMDSGLIYQALRDGQVDAGPVFSTDGPIPAFDFVLLEDDRTYHIPQVMTSVATEEVLPPIPSWRPFSRASRAGPSSASGSRVPPHRIMAAVLEITSSMRSAASGRSFDVMDALPSMLLVLH